MELNLLSLFFNPKANVKNAVKDPNFSKAFFIVLLPAIVYLLSFILIGLDIELAGFISYAIKNYVMWVVTASMVYFFVFLAKGKEMKGKFAGIYSSLSYIWIIIAIAFLITAVVMFAFNPKFFAFVGVVKTYGLSAVDSTSLLGIMTSQNVIKLNDFKEEHGINEDLTPLMLGENEPPISSQTTGLLFVAWVLLLFYALFIYPFYTIKVVTKLSYAASFILYIFSMSVTLFLALGMSFF